MSMGESGCEEYGHCNYNQVVCDVSCPFFHWNGKIIPDSAYLLSPPQRRIMDRKLYKEKRYGDCDYGDNADKKACGDET